MTMGGGGGGGIDPRDLEKLEKIAKQKLGEKSPSNSPHVFLSFVEEDLNKANMLRLHAKNDQSEISFDDHSVKTPFDSKDAEYIRRAIREKIRRVSVTIVYLSDRTAGSNWVDWEIRESLKLGKSVIGVYSDGAKPKTLPAAFDEFSLNTAPWKSKELADAIKAASKTR